LRVGLASFTTGERGDEVEVVVVNRELAGHLLWHLHRAWSGACLCRRRLLGPAAMANVGEPIIDLRGRPDHPLHLHTEQDLDDRHDHDVDYYAWEAVRIVSIAERVSAAAVKGHLHVIAALEHLRCEAPKLEAFRNAATYPDDCETAGDDVVPLQSALRLRRGGRIEYYVDPRYEHHDALRQLVFATRGALSDLAPEAYQALNVRWTTE
jgi:hypothetical protein